MPDPVVNTDPNAVTDPKNNANPTVNTPPVQTVDPAEVERLRKEAEQATMRANQLANQLKAKEDAEAAERAKQLEEQNQYKTLYEQEKAKRAEVEAERAAAEKAAVLKAESDKLFAQYPEQVKTLAQEAGMTLADTDEDSISTLKAKLDKVKDLVKAPARVTPNNPGSSMATPVTADMKSEDIRAIANDPKKFDEYMKKNYQGVAGMMGR